MKTNLRVLISGGGIAGNALALWLSRLGHKVVVVEKFPSLRVTGLQLDLRGHGVEVMKRTGLEAAICTKLAWEEGMRVVDSSGKERAYFPANKSGKGSQSLTSEYEIMRGDLCRLFYESALKSSVKPTYRFGTLVESFTQRDDKVQVRYQGGGGGEEEEQQEQEFDLLVGADGQWSRTRRLMHANGNKTATAASQKNDDVDIIPNLYFAYFTMRRPIQEGEKYVSTTYMATGRRGIMTRRHSQEELQVMLSCNNSSEPMRTAQRGNATQEKAALADIFRGCGWISDDVVQGMMDADDFHCERPGVVQMDRWSRRRVVLIGDAAHCPTVLSGMGTTTAVMGAYILAGEIARHATNTDDPNAGLTVALEQYEAKFRPFVDQVQEGIVGQAAYRYSMPDSALAIGMMNWGLGLASWLKVNIAEMWGIKETVKNWHLPEYTELHGQP